MQHRVFLALLLSFCTSLLVVGQSQTAKPADDKDDVVRITTNLVQVDAVVTKDGKPITNLKAEDFEIYEDGRRKEITSFAFISNVTSRERSSVRNKTDADVPPRPVSPDVPHRIIAVVVDDLGLSLESMSHVRRQLRTFVTEQLQPNDVVAVIRTGGAIGTLQQFTNDRRLLTRAVDQLRWNPCSRMGTSIFPRYGQPRTKADWENCDPFDDGTNKALHIILDGLARIPGRKSLVFMSDDMPISRKEIEGAESGIAVGSTAPIGPTSLNRGDALQRIVEKAIRSSVVIYSVDTLGLQVTGLTAADNATAVPVIGATQPKIAIDDPRPANAMMMGRSHLLQLRREGAELVAKKTGGFQIRNSNGFQLDRILEDQSGYYLLGYRPTEETFNRQFHQIKVKVKSSRLTVRTRSGFYGVTEEEARRAQLSARDETNLALGSPFGAQDIELNLMSFFANAKADGSIVRSFIYVDPTNLTFTPVNERQETSLEIHGVIFGDNGAIVQQIKHSAVLSLRENEYREAMQDGLRLRFDMPAKTPGSYQVRIAVRDRTSSKIGSAGQFVVVPDLNQKRVALSGVVLRAATEGPVQLSTMSNPPARRFPANAELNYGFVVYNPTIDPATQLPNLTMQVKLYRDGNSVGPAVEAPIDVKNQADLSRLFITGSVRLSSNLEPGDYYLQVVVTDKAAKDKQSPVTQWVNFEIVK